MPQVGQVPPTDPPQLLHAGSHFPVWVAELSLRPRCLTANGNPTYAVNGEQYVAVQVNGRVIERSWF